MLEKDTNQTVRQISAKISEKEIELAKEYIKNAVDSHCNNSPDKTLSVRILFGGEKRDWGGTPLQCIYNYYEQKGKSDPMKDAAIGVGWLLKAVLKADLSRTFRCVKKTTGKEYKLVVQQKSHVTQ